MKQRSITRVCKTEEDRQITIKLLQGRNLPMTVTLSPGVKRTYKQNRLQQQWYRDAERQGDCTAEEYRAYCKLHFGVPILLEEFPDFREKWERIVKPLPYELKLELMLEPFDFQVTRLMTTVQKKAFMDKVQQHLSGLGFYLTDPDMLGRHGY